MATSEFTKQLVIDRFKPDSENYPKFLSASEDNWPTFDTRCYNLPESDIVNYFYWRLQDCLRNSISMLAQSKFSHKQLQGKSNTDKQEMLFKDFGINWSKIPQYQKSGFACVRRMTKINSNGSEVERNKWQIIDGPCTRSEVDEEIKKALAPKI